MPTSIIARDWTIVRSLPVRQIEQHFIDITPAPALRRIIALDDRMLRGVEMPGCVFVGRIVTAADVAAGAADPQMQPLAAALQALLAAERARRDVVDATEVGAAFRHPLSLSLKRRFRGIAEKSMHRRHHVRALADRAADPLDRSRAHVADGEY